VLSTNNNIMALNVGRSITRNSVDSTNVIARLGSGQRIERAADDAAGLSISEGMRSELVQLDNAKSWMPSSTSLAQVLIG
jgi:flagellin